jgi:plasmid stability protein
MKNLTMAVPDETLERFRVYAAQRRTSVNALLRQFMDDMLDGEAGRRAAIDQILSRTAQTGARIDMRGWNRENSHGRDQ